MYRGWYFYLGGTLAGLLAGCSGDVLQPSSGTSAMGAVEVSATTTGEVPDSDGYTLVVDSKPTSTLGSNSSITFAEVAGRHELGLTGVARNCTVNGDTTRPVTVIEQDTVRVSFQITCQSGAVEITTESSGDTPDPDGYTVSIDGKPRPERIPTTGVFTVSGIPVGHHFLQLTDVAPNCSIFGQSPVAFDVTAAASASVRLQLNCVAFGTLRVITRTTGYRSDLVGYNLTVDAELSQPIDINASLTSRRAPGVHSVTLLGVPNNCLADSASRTVKVESRAETKVVFTIDCAPPGMGRIEVLTQSGGSSRETSGFEVEVDGENAQPIGLTASVVLTHLSSGQHTVELTGTTRSCAILSDNPQEVMVLPQATTRVVFNILCFDFPFP